MPILTDVRKVKKVKLPKTGATLELYDDVLFADVQKVSQIENEAEKNIAVALMYIKSWDFTTEDGTTVPINKENFERMPATDVIFLTEFIGNLNVEKKSKEPVEK